MKQTSFDQWLTRDPGFNGDGLMEVTADEWVDDGGAILIDEHQCTECGAYIGWLSDSGFTPFWTNETETAYFCVKCPKD